MKHLKIIISLLFIGLITLTINFKVYAGDVWKFEWSNTKIEIPLGGNANLYKDKPQARLIKNNKIMKDATISIDSNGDWMYYFRNINTNKCGSYYVWYKAFESKYRPGTCTNYKCLVQFQVVDKEAPVISFLSDNVTLKRGTNINLLDNVNYSDNSNCECELKILSDIDYTKIGTYDVIVSCKDVNNNISKKSFKLTIYDDAKPKIYCKNNGSIITIPYKGEYDLSKYFEALDPFDGDISNKIQYPLFSNDKIGKFEYTVSVENSNYKTDSLTVLIDVIDEIEPVLTVKNKNIIIDYDIDLDNYDFLSNIDIKDNQEINYDNLSINHNIKKEIGNYTINYSYTDGFFTVSDSANLSIIASKAPEIVTDYLEIEKDSYVNLLNYIEIIDDSDPNIYREAIVDDSKVDYSKTGVYDVNVYVMNSSGLVDEKVIKVLIINSSNSNGGSKSGGSSNIGLYVLVGINLGIFWFIIIGGIIFFIVYKKRKKNNVN